MTKQEEIRGICPYKPRPQCDFRKKGECAKSVGRPIPMGHIGGQIMPVGVIGGLVDEVNPGRDFVLIPRMDWADGCCEYIKERGEILRHISKRRRTDFVHDLSIYEPLVEK